MNTNYHVESQTQFPKEDIERAHTNNKKGEENSGIPLVPFWRLSKDQNRILLDSPDSTTAQRSDGLRNVRNFTNYVQSIYF